MTKSNHWSSSLTISSQTLEWSKYGRTELENNELEKIEICEDHQNAVVKLRVLKDKEERLRAAVEEKEERKLIEEENFALEENAYLDKMQRVR